MRRGTAEESPAGLAGLGGLGLRGLAGLRDWRAAGGTRLAGLAAEGTETWRGVVQRVERLPGGAGWEDDCGAP
jgi:hypothetical protein